MLSFQKFGKSYILHEIKELFINYKIKNYKKPMMMKVIACNKC